VTSAPPLPRSPSRAAIEALLVAHRPADEREARDVERVRALLRRPAPFWRGTFLPGHLTASAVVVDPDRTQALLVFHGKLERWLQPGGHFEPDEEDPLLAARREVREETGVLAEPDPRGPLLLDVDVHRIPARKKEPAHEHFDLRLLLVAAPGRVEAGEGTRAARWVPRAELAGLDLDPGLIRALGKVGLA
jgi:8-oxo-dGTP pyrophosphatase MutT (NUDIX family)